MNERETLDYFSMLASSQDSLFFAEIRGYDQPSSERLRFLYDIKPTVWTPSFSHSGKLFFLEDSPTPNTLIKDLSFNFTTSHFFRKIIRRLEF